MTGRYLEDRFTRGWWRAWTGEWAGFSTRSTNAAAPTTLYVLLTSDNGPYLGRQEFAGGHFSLRRYNGPFRGQKSDVLEGGIRVPGIVRWPAGLPGGAECHAMIHFCDWLPTLAATAGATPGGRPLDGCKWPACAAPPRTGSPK